MRQYWDTLSSREQLILLGGSIVLLILLYFLLFIDPLRSGIRETNKKIALQQQSLAWMQTAQQEVRSLSNNEPLGASSQSLFAAVDQKVRTLQLKQALKRLEPSENNKVRLWFEDADFAKLTQLLLQLQQKEGTHVDSLTISRDDLVGRVDAKIVLSRKP